MTIKDEKFIVHFDHAEGLTTHDQKPPTAFWIADDSKKWTRAEARIIDKTIVLSSPKVLSPKHIRYAFAGRPQVNLIKAAGLPARSFRTDTFEP